MAALIERNGCFQLGARQKSRLKHYKLPIMILAFFSILFLMTIVNFNSFVIISNKLKPHFRNDLFVNLIENVEIDEEVQVNNSIDWNILRKQFLEKGSISLDKDLDEQFNKNSKTKKISISNKFEDSKFMIRKDSKPLDLYNKLRTTLTNPVKSNNSNDDKTEIDVKISLCQILLLTLTKMKDSANYLFTSFQYYYQWLKSNDKLNENLPFILNYITLCYVSNNTVPANKARDVLLIDRIIDKNELFVGQLCSHIFNNSTSLPVYMSKFYDYINNNNISISDVNVIIKVLGKTSKYTEIYKLFDVLIEKRTEKKTNLILNDESFEFLANAFVKNVEEEITVRAMKDLPRPTVKTSEILLAGRSNVGKSSLVNFVVNRKALASTSATPGHTKQFHFYSVNKNRADLPNFFLVDVPGLGYAEASNNSMDSWKNVIDRYISVRESLSIVLHLVDSRHGITKTDQQLIDMLIRAINSRNDTGIPLFDYKIILTKTDRITSNSNQLTNQINDIKEKTLSISKLLNKPVDIISTSIINKEGRYELWKILQPFLTR